MEEKERAAAAASLALGAPACRPPSTSEADLKDLVPVFEKVRRVPSRVRGEDHHPPSSAAAAAALALGARVEVFGLSSAAGARLNGRRGRVLRRQASPRKSRATASVLSKT